MPRPGVSVNIMNGQLGLQGPSENGITALVLSTPAAPTGVAYGVAFVVKTKADVIAKFADVLNAPVVTALNNGFYAEAPEGTELHITCMAQVTQLDTLAAAANVEKSLNSAAGKARLVGVIKFPAGGYVATPLKDLILMCMRLYPFYRLLQIPGWLLKNHFGFLYRAMAIPVLLPTHWIMQQLPTATGIL